MLQAPLQTKSARGICIAMSNPIVVGAGPLGLITALALNERFEKITLIGPEAPTDGRTTAILNEGLELLDSLGVWSKLAGKTAPLKTMRIVDGTKRLIRAPEARFECSELGVDCFGHNIKNGDLLDALHQTIAARETITWIKQSIVDASVRADEASSLSLKDGSILKTSLVLAADGKNSLLREKAGIGARRWSYPQVALVMNLSHSRDHGFTSTEFHTENGPFTLVPLPGRQSSLVWVEKPETARQILALPDGEIARRIAEKSHYLLGDITLASTPMGYPLSGLIAHEFGRASIALIGESAHVFPPIGAQGMNLRIRDVKAFLKCLERHPLDASGGPSALTAAYSKARRADISLRTGAVDTLNRSLLTGLLPVHLGRGAGLFAMNTLPFLRKFVMKQGLGAH